MESELIQAARQGDTPAVQSLLAAGAKVDAQDDKGQTALMAATYGNHIETARVLVEAGADVNLRDQSLNSPFLYAGAEGLLEIVKLTAPTADTHVTNRYGGVAVIPAAEKGHVETVAYLLEHTDMDVNHVNNLGWTALLEAIILSNGGPTHQRIIEILLQYGADVNLADKDGVTPLQHARQRGYREIIEMLEAAGGR
jgi:ankyrin repeat protein